MRRLLPLSVALALTALLTVTGFVVHGDDDGTWLGKARLRRTRLPGRARGRGRAQHRRPQRRPDLYGPREIRPATCASSSAIRMVDAAQQALRDAIAASDAVGDDVTFEISYLNCGEGYGWAHRG